MQHCSIQAGLQIYGRQVTVAQKVRLQLGESDGNSADVQQHKQKMPKTDTLDALDAAMTTILTTNLDNYSKHVLNMLLTYSEPTLNLL